MSKIGNWVFEMQEDAQWCSREVFIRKHGVGQAVVWDEVQAEMNGETVDAEAYWGSREAEGYYGA